jgi:hypothetical protein
MTPNPLPSLERFDRAAAWATRTPDQQADIGAVRAARRHLDGREHDEMPEVRL